MEEGGNDRKEHRKRQAGPKAKKKKEKIEHVQELTAKQRNPKAFAVQSVNKAARSVRRTLDIQAKKHHLPEVDRTPIEPPPIVVAIVGPPKVGKTTLMNCLIKNFTKQRLSTIEGPVTIVSGKKKRITLIECNNDINAMIDVAKIADLILLLVDASFGFEMEIFEFLNICQVHGFPKVMGVLTHLDYFRDSKVLRKTKKRLKNRFWTEIYQGAKLFYLSGMINGEYQKTEIHNLGRFISVMKFQPINWRVAHPHLLADRMEDVTNPETMRQNAKCDRTICLYGYLRGTFLRSDSNIHLPGCGDFTIKDVSNLSDPCPLPHTIKKRSLNQRERLIYAPMSGVGGIVYDKDAVYIDLKGSHSHSATEDNSQPQGANKLVLSLIDTKHTLDEKMATSEMSLFTSAEPILHDEFKDESGRKHVIDTSTGRKRRRVTFGDDENDSDGDENSDEDEEDGDENSDDVDDNSDGDSDKEMPEKTLKLDSSLKGRKNSTSKIEELAFADSDDDLEAGDISLWSNKTNKVVNVDINKYPSSSAKNTDVSDKIRSLLQNVDNKDDKMSDSGCSSDGSDVEDENDVDSDVEGEDVEKMDISNKSSQNGAESDEEKGHLKWKDNLLEKASADFMTRQKSTTNWHKYVYNTQDNDDQGGENDNDEVGGIFMVLKKKPSSETKGFHGRDSSLPTTAPTSTDWEQILDSIKDCFVTGKWSKGDDAKALLDQDDEMFGEFEDLETGEVTTGKGEVEDESGSVASGDEEKTGEVDKKLMSRAEIAIQKRKEKKARLKAMFDSEYDGTEGGATYLDELRSEVEKQSQFNKSEFEDLDDDLRIQYEGYRPGMYVRVEIENLPCEFVTNFDASYPVIVGGLLNVEDTIGYVKVRLKKHRWHKKILKTRDPLVFSLGWRRFQSIPLYTVEDHNMRNRLLKYTPQHLHCHASFWGPITPQNTGFLAVQTVSSTTRDFRIAATGVVVSLDKSTVIVKKLKLIGTPLKIHKKTAFIKGMFNSALEVAKFEGAALRTVSGIRGQIKKAIKSPQGAYRATFEDRMLLSDIVFMRTWYPVQVPRFYNTVTTLLLPSSTRNKWEGMKTLGQLKYEQGIKNVPNEDSLYKPIERKEKFIRPLRIPIQLQRQLPFKDKPKSAKKIRDSVQKGRIAVIPEKKEQQVKKLMKMMKAVHKDKMLKQRLVMKTRVVAHKKKRGVHEERVAKKRKELKKQAYVTLGLNENRKKRFERK